ncbi:uncharacterized protein LOC116349060 [Contarinia nasturtii]|uniref:uncharacterized protein LOC116349060 n=1 Tax=Contarinia nasturtii TaxID=265458 RepID=UPI0012D3E670|nr:uncharacterized protein LOC116349060 [Contarinia nasturtii]
MKFNHILCGIFVLILLHLTVFVSASTIQRSLSDDIRNGISIAGKIFGVDSPSNIAIISNIAELVTRSFATNSNTNANGNRNNGWDRRHMTERYPSDHLEDFDELPQNIQQNTPNDQGNIEDNVITGSTKPTTGIDSGFLGQVIRIMGMDTGKIGAIAINGIIFIAQMIGRSLISAFTTVKTGMGTKPNENIEVFDRIRRFKDENVEEEIVDEESQSIWDDTIGWILEQRKNNPFLSKHIDAMLDKNLPERLVNMVDNGNGRDDTSTDANSDCVKQLLCKTAPFIWSMQKAVSSRMNNSDTEASTTDDLFNDNAKSAENSTDDGNHMNAFFKYLPTFDEFKNRGVTCEDQYKECKIF